MTVHSGCAHVSVVRRTTGLNEGNDFTGRCRRGAQEEDGQNAEYNLYLFQNLILDQIWGKEGAGNENGFCLFVYKSFLFVWFCSSGGMFLWTTRTPITSLALFWWDLGHSFLQIAQSTPMTKCLQLRAVAMKWQVELVRDKILPIACP